MKIRNQTGLLFFFTSLFFVSVSLVNCKSFGGVQKETSPLNYSDCDVAQNEKNRITALLEKNPIEAFWRSLLLNDEETIAKCVDAINNQVSNNVESKDYFEASRYLKSLETAGYKYDGMTYAEADKLARSDIPGFTVDKEKLPSSISDCVKATVTVLVDRGIKIQNGAGYADKVIGSGFFIDRRGYIVTNYHVISDMVDSKYEGFSRLYVKLTEDDDEKTPAKVIGYDSVLDLALIKTELVPEFVLSLGSSSDLKVGDKINVIGAPLGLEGSMSAGIVSSTDRKIFTLGSVFQIDAPVNGGNSGGPCIDQNLKVQAVVFAGVMQAQGLNFAIPIEYLKQELPYLYHGGEVNHSWVGGYGHTKRNGNKRVGVDVQYITPGSPAMMAGLKTGDVIYQMDDKKITTIESLQEFYRENTPNSIVKCYYRNADDEEKSVLLYVDKRPESPAVEVYNSDLIQNSFAPLFGMLLVPSSTENRKTYKIENIISGSVADENGFSVNDSVTVRNIILDDENEYIITQIVTKRRKKGFLDLMMMLGSPYDSVNYF